MNRRPLISLPLGKAITGFVNYKTAEGLSDRSVDSYKRILEHWADYAENKKSEPAHRSRDQCLLSLYAD